MKTICIYHGNCFDGMAAAWVVSKVYPDAEFIPGFYGDKKLQTNLMQDCYENANINDRYIIVDFSLPRDLMILMHNKAKEMIVLDHHKTAEENCKGLEFCIFDMNESGASLAWKYFSELGMWPYQEKMPLLISYIKDRDLWLFKEDDSEEINSYIQSFPMSIENYEYLYDTLKYYPLEKVIDIGKGINRYKQTMVEAICKNAMATNHYPFYDNRIPIVNTSILFSEVGHELCKMFPTAPYAAYYYDIPKRNVRQWGLRSIGDFDVSEVAKRFGGGGHKNAAGFEQRLDEI